MSIIRDGFQSADLDVPVVLPTLNLDFANSQELDPRITFSRGSIGTFVNKNGLIETASANIPRFDYDPISGECRGLLIEEQRTNIVLNSTTLSSHNNSGTTEVLTTETTSPDGTFSAYKIIGNSGAKARESIYTNSFTMSANKSYTASVFLKGTTNRRYAVIWFDNTGPGNAPVEGPFYGTAAFLDLIAGTSSNSIVKMISYGNGWYRCYITATVGASNLTNVYFNVSLGSPNGFSDTGQNNIYKYVGDGISGIYYWGPQVEEGAFPTTYIPTGASTVTRNPDNADMTGSNFTSWANSSVGTFVIRGMGGLESTQNGYGRFVGLGQGGSIGREGLSTRVGIWDTTNIFAVTNNSADVVNRNSNIAASFDGTLRRVVLNGVASSGISRRNINTIFTQIGLGKNGNSSTNYLNGTLSRVAYYPRQLNDAQMLYLTT
jgi:hypothetical protein